MTKIELTDEQRQLMGTPEAAKADLIAKLRRWRELRQPHAASRSVHKQREAEDRELRFQIANAALLWLWHEENPARERVTIKPGSEGDPEREDCFRSIQLALAGAHMGAALAAQIDSLGVSVVVAAETQVNAADILAGIGRDLAKTVDDNWDLVKGQLPHAISTPGQA